VFLELHISVYVTEQALDSAERVLARLHEYRAHTQELLYPRPLQTNAKARVDFSTLVRSEKWGPAERALHRNLLETQEAVRAALCDDFDTPRALKELLRLISVANNYSRGVGADGPNADTPAFTPRLPLVANVHDYVTQMLGCFGFSSKVSGCSSAQGASDVHSQQEITQVASQTEVALAAFSSFRDEVRLEAIKATKNQVDLKQRSEHVAAILAACDRARDATFPSLGYSLQDKKDGARFRPL
jgi:cysteinyl-tRNA synthetase